MVKNKRLITEKQETALRLCHQNFLGLSSKEAAKRMGISQAALNGLLARLKKNPRFRAYFPILTKAEAKRYHLYAIEGWNVNDIAEHFGVTPRSIYKALQRAKNKGMFFSDAKGRVLSYDEGMDAHVKRKF